jgi:hypothetical protein
VTGALNAPRAEAASALHPAKPPSQGLLQPTAPASTVPLQTTAAAVYQSNLQVYFCVLTRSYQP